MAALPDEIWTDILDYLDPNDILSTQRVSSHLLRVARDSRLWRYKCYEKAPSAAKSLSDRPNALSALTGALGGLSLSDESTPEPAGSQPAYGTRLSKRAIAVAEWDHTSAYENLDWYSEYIGRHAPLSVVWADSKPRSPDIRGMALLDDCQKVISPLDDGSLRIWNIKRNDAQRPSLAEVSTSRTGLLFQDLSMSPASSKTIPRSLGYATDNIVVDNYRNRAYVSAENYVNEVDLASMTVISQQHYAWPITALSQVDDGYNFNLTIGTSWSLHIHDPRMPLGSPRSPEDNTVESNREEDSPGIAFLPNYAKLEGHSKTVFADSSNDNMNYFSSSLRVGSRSYARVEPGPQSILHRGQDEIIIAGRMPSILFYDRRFFPRLKSSIHSGARLSSLATLPYAPTNDTAEDKATHTLIACGDYRGRGSLEIYGLSAESQAEGQQGLSRRLSTTAAFQQLVQMPSSTTLSPGRFSYQNRHTASSSKLLAVCVQGARILFSDAEGQLKWVERDGRGVARRWNINAASYNYSLGGNKTAGSAMANIPVNGGLSSNADVAHKLLPISSSQHNFDSGSITRGDDDILVLTGEKIGIVTTRPQSSFSDSLADLEKAFESKMDLDSGSSDEERSKEEEYARQMRRALERQADERRWMSRFGGRWR